MAAANGSLLALATLGFLGCRAEPQPASGSAEPPTVAEPAPTEAQPIVAAPAPSEPAADAPAIADAEPAAALAATAAADPASEKPAEPASPPGPYKVLILGDSLAATGFGALLERRLDAHPLVVCFRKAKSASGLARPDFFDWMKEGKRQVDLRPLGFGECHPLALEVGAGVGHRRIEKESEELVRQVVMGLDLFAKRPELLGHESARVGGDRVS